MFDGLEIQSYQGAYKVHFGDAEVDALLTHDDIGKTFIIDRLIADLYADRFAEILSAPSTLLIDATEGNKSLEKMPDYVDHLVEHKVRRGSVLVAIGGGITQDITCFLSATYLRGVDWHFIPTTLLAQADSCIGSKSSINCRDTKNILGTFTPPRSIAISTTFLETLNDVEIRSGIGEIIKVHAIDGMASCKALISDYDRLADDPDVLAQYIRSALLIKQRYIEEDEFDRGIRNIFNYGHTFGHAIEAATEFEIPHGIAVTIGMDMANFIAAGLGVGTQENFDQLHPMLTKNFRGFEQTIVPIEKFMNAISKDKKNMGAGQVTLILMKPDGTLSKDGYLSDAIFAGLCTEYLEQVRPT